MLMHTQREQVEQGNHWRSQPLLMDLKGQLDRRLVTTFLKAVIAILRHRHRQLDLLLSELGSFLLSPSGRAGTNRLSNLIHCAGWSWADIDDFLWQQADHQAATLTRQSVRMERSARAIS